MSFPRTPEDVLRMAALMSGGKRARVRPRLPVQAKLRHQNRVKAEERRRGLPSATKSAIRCGIDRAFHYFVSAFIAPPILREQIAEGEERS